MRAEKLEKALADPYTHKFPNCAVKPEILEAAKLLHKLMTEMPPELPGITPSEWGSNEMRSWVCKTIGIESQHKDKTE